MKARGNIVFLGMMGSGKTTIGKLVSKRLKLDFIDIDDFIVKKFGMKVTKIFSSKGEKFFRNVEEKITLEVLKKENIVASLGGGAFINKKIRNEVLDKHESFWLNLNYKELLKRLKNSKKRPIINNSSTTELISLIKKRSTIYSKAKYKIDCDGLTKYEIVGKILNIYENSKTHS
tara:strand:+ start:59 stop:583 length:525 start_codon:yes stop_codon:yes gene_type:complete